MTITATIKSVVTIFFRVECECQLGAFALQITAADGVSLRDQG
jgi:hypothetical protein